MFVLDDLARVGQAYWGGYGVAKHGLAALVGMLQAELANSQVRVTGLQPGPMRTPLRAKAYVEESDRAARDPAAYAEPASPAVAGRRGPSRPGLERRDRIP